MNVFKRCGCAFVIFVAGGNTFLNLSSLKYGSPNPLWEGSWIKVAVSCVIAIFLTVLMIRQRGRGYAVKILEE